jgi:hypothetical protein
MESTLRGIDDVATSLIDKDRMRRVLYVSDNGKYNEECEEADDE